MKSVRILSTALLGMALLAAACGGKSTPAETCDDGVWNQYESDVDCGGSCQACADGRACIVDADCLSGNCMVGICEPDVSQTCDDQILNQDETDVDCGGDICAPCADGGACATDDDCASGNCEAGTCEPDASETCDDQILNQDETDVDCGGLVCNGCADGAACLAGSDCTSGYCDNGVCTISQEDLCPDDPDKDAPGVCGCGTPDTDTDSDGFADCIDGCPNDADKIEAGQCGCGVADTDTDGDAVADCDDGCPDDVNKTDPGDCGCGVPDTDSDGDQVPDCADGCPDDPNKMVPGDCDCGTPDTDSDSDGVADCIDGCPDDAAKIEPGQCGCGNPDTDSDFDGTADCDDLCPNDANKIDPGVCGCGTPDVDTDGDGALDCNDQCPFDPAKTAPETCGCGFPDTDTDGDGLADCLDNCPVDPTKTEPGLCGCGIPDTDSDGDATPDCNDGCDFDPAKVAPGQCGCGVPDTDSDADGTADCNDGCPQDPAKLDPGVCGCGVPDLDQDGDGVADCIDNCPDVPNPGQEDTNGNGIGDACESFIPPLACDTDTYGVVSGDPWVVCDADLSTAWISADSSGTYRINDICIYLGYDGASQWGGTCGDVCGYCQGGTSCANPGQRTFDGSTGCSPPDTHCTTVMWECSRQAVTTWVGPRTNFDISELTGWTQCHAEPYGTSATPLSTIQANCPGSNLLLACRQVGSDTITLAAHAPRADVLYDTGTGNTPHDANGVGWYYSDSTSWGFALQGDPITRNTCDTQDSSFDGHAGVNGDLRLCWHASGGTLDGGWRCGLTDDLNADNTWERLVFSSDF